MKTDKYRAVYQLEDSEYQLIEEINHGQFGTVYRAKRVKRDRQNGGELYSEIGALKVIEICSKEKFNAQKSQYKYNKKLVWEYFDHLEKEALAEVRNQKRVLQEDGRYVVNIKECDIYKEKFNIYLLIFMELLTPLTEILEKRYLSEQEIYKLGRQIALALKICHKNGIYHRDIKASNIFITEYDQNFKLGDFGISQMMTEDTYTKMVSGSPWYMAPEIIFEKGQHLYNESIDIYSLGILLYYLFNRHRYPFLPLDENYGERELAEAFQHKKNYDRPDFPVNAPAPLADVILEMIQKPEMRIENTESFLEKWNSAGRRLYQNTEKSALEKELDKKYAGTISVEEISGNDTWTNSENTGEAIPDISGECSSNRKNRMDGEKTKSKKKKSNKGRIFVLLSIVFSFVLTIVFVAVIVYYSKNQNWRERSEEISMSHDISSTEMIAAEALTQEETDSYTLKSTVEFIYENNVLIEYRGKSEEIILPDGLEGIGNQAFADNLKLSQVIIPDGVRYIGNSAFKNCKSLSAIELPDTVTSIGEYAFSGCERLSEINFSENLMEIGDYAFLGCGELKTVSFPDSLHSIGKMAFLSCISLEEIEFGLNLQIVGDSAFQSCIALEKAVVNSMDCRLENNVFASCDKNLIIFCPENSEAHAYAIEHDIQYQFLQ